MLITTTFSVSKKLCIIFFHNMCITFFLYPLIFRFLAFLTTCHCGKFYVKYVINKEKEHFGY